MLHLLDNSCHLAGLSTALAAVNLAEVGQRHIAETSLGKNII